MIWHLTCPRSKSRTYTPMVVILPLDPGENSSSSLRYGSYQLHNVFGSARYLKYRNPTALIYGESGCFKRPCICLTVSFIVKNLYRRQNAVEGPRQLPVIHGST
nr:hypothetical protein Iba_chr02cCG4100 [Ipomoea batatas]GMC67597.1 hypothetical protein Iba_chr02fCG4010 [Ipomoea batatas]